MTNTLTPIDVWLKFDTNEDEECTHEAMSYSVYTLTDGELGTDEVYDNEKDAWDMFALFSGMERNRSRTDPDYVETTIHLYHSDWGNMLAEECFTPDYQDPRSPLFGVNVAVTETWMQG